MAPRSTYDRRRGDARIADGYDWPTLHHIHCVARAILTGAQVDPGVQCTFLVCQATGFPEVEGFDYGDQCAARTVFLRSHDLCLFGVLDDAQAVAQLMAGFLQKLDGPFSILQLRELGARLAFGNLRLDPRPDFYSEPSGATMRLRVKLPDFWELAVSSDEVFGSVMHLWCGDLVAQSKVENAEQIVEHVRTGRWSFPLDDTGNFTPHGTIPQA